MVRAICGDFEGVGEARAIVVAFVVDEDLGLVFEPAEGGRVDDAVAVALVGAAVVGLSRVSPAAAVGRCAQA